MSLLTLLHKLVSRLHRTHNQHGGAGASETASDKITIHEIQERSERVERREIQRTPDTDAQWLDYLHDMQRGPRVKAHQTADNDLILDDGSSEGWIRAGADSVIDWRDNR